MLSALHFRSILNTISLTRSDLSEYAFYMLNVNVLCVSLSDLNHFRRKMSTQISLNFSLSFST